MTTTVEDYRSLGHALAVPVSDEELWEVTAAFLADGLAVGEQAVFFDDDDAAPRILERLADDGVPVAEPLREGRISIVPAQVTRRALVGPIEELGHAVTSTIDGALEAGFSGVRLCGLLRHGLQRTGDTMLDCDRVLDRALRDRPAHMLCLYDSTRFPEDLIAGMRTLHDTELVAPAVYDDGLLRITSSGPGRARVAGEVDHSNRQRLRKLLETALDNALRAPDPPPDITLDLSSLRFLDVGGAVGLVHAAEEFPSALRLVLTGVRPRVHRILDRCGAPFAAQLAVHARRTPDDAPDGHPEDPA